MVTWNPNQGGKKLQDLCKTLKKYIFKLWGFAVRNHDQTTNTLCYIYIYIYDICVCTCPGVYMDPHLWTLLGCPSMEIVRLTRYESLDEEAQRIQAQSKMCHTDLPNVMVQHGAAFKGMLPNLQNRVTKTDALQRGAVSKRIVPNVRHRVTQNDAHKRGAVSKGIVANVRHRVTKSDAPKRGAVSKGIVANVRHRVTQSDARKGGAVSQRHSPQCAPQSLPKWFSPKKSSKKRHSSQCASPTLWWWLKLG